MFFGLKTLVGLLVVLSCLSCSIYESQGRYEFERDFEEGHLQQSGYGLIVEAQRQECLNFVLHDQSISVLQAEFVDWFDRCLKVLDQRSEFQVGE